jgi:hypothetical protein
VRRRAPQVERGLVSRFYNRSMIMCGMIVSSWLCHFHGAAAVGVARCQERAHICRSPEPARQRCEAFT